MTTIPAPGADKATDEQTMASFRFALENIAKYRTDVDGKIAARSMRFYAEHALEGFAAGAAMQSQHQDTDGCKFCLGAKGGVPGNANVIGGETVCDYCTSLLMKVVGAEKVTPTTSIFAAPAGTVVARPDLASLIEYERNARGSDGEPPYPVETFYLVADVQALFAAIPAPQAPDQAEMLREVIRMVRQYPDFDADDNPFGIMMDEALAGKTPTLLSTIDSLANGLMPHDQITGEKK